MTTNDAHARPRRRRSRQRPTLTLLLCLVLLLVGTYHATALRSVPARASASAEFPGVPSGYVPLRYLAINVGNATLLGCAGRFESKLCDPRVATAVRAYIAFWQPDVVMLSEAYNYHQFALGRTIGVKGDNVGGPVLPPGYGGFCDTSVDRFTHRQVAYNAPNASHEHECVGWKLSRLRNTDNGASEFGRNDRFALKNRLFVGTTCSYDFTAFGVGLSVIKHPRIRFHAVAEHPESEGSPVASSYHRQCRIEEIDRYWAHWGVGPLIIGGDWNTQSVSAAVSPKFLVSYTNPPIGPPVQRYELRPPAGFGYAYSWSYHWLKADNDPRTWNQSDPKLYPLSLYPYANRRYMAHHVNGLTQEDTADYPPTHLRLDHVFANFGKPCLSCGLYYNDDIQLSLPYGSALGEHEDLRDDSPIGNVMPRADDGSGMDHRQILVDMLVEDRAPPPTPTATPTATDTPATLTTTDTPSTPITLASATAAVCGLVASPTPSATGTLATATAHPTSTATRTVRPVGTPTRSARPTPRTQALPALIRSTAVHPTITRGPASTRTPRPTSTVTPGRTGSPTATRTMLTTTPTAAPVCAVTTTATTTAAPTRATTTTTAVPTRATTTTTAVPTRATTTATPVPTTTSTIALPSPTTSVPPPSPSALPSPSTSPPTVQPTSVPPPSPSTSPPTTQPTFGPLPTGTPGQPQGTRTAFPSTPVTARTTSETKRPRGPA